MLNQVILVGRLTAIVKKKGKIESFKVIIPRTNELEEDRPIVVVPPEIGESIYGLIKDGIVVEVKARIETEVKGGYGTVTKIVAQKITVLKKQKRQDIFLDKISNKYSNDPEENIYPKPMTDAEFVRLVTDYLLGEDWYIADPVSPDQANVYIAAAIIEKFNIKK